MEYLKPGVNPILSWWMQWFLNLATEDPKARRLLTFAVMEVDDEVSYYVMSGTSSVAFFYEPSYYRNATLHWEPVVSHCAGNQWCPIALGANNVETSHCARSQRHPIVSGANILCECHIVPGASNVKMSQYARSQQYPVMPGASDVEMSHCAGS